MARATTLWMLYLARVIDGATAGNISLAQAYISDNSDPKDRTKSFALIGITFGLGFLIGPLLTANLVNYRLSAPIYAASAMSLLRIICTLVLFPPPVAYLILGPTRTIPWLVVVSTISSFGNGVLRPTLTSLVSQNAGRHEQGVAIGLTQSLSSVAQNVAPIVGGILIRKEMLTLWA